MAATSRLIKSWKPGNYDTLEALALTPWNMPSVLSGDPNGAPPFVVPLPRQAA